MQKRVFMTTMALGVFLALNQVQGQMMGSGPEMMENQQQAIKAKQQRYRNMPHYGMMDEYGYGPGRMHGYGMDHGMMGGRHGMGWGMMGGQGYCQGPMHMFDYGSEEYDRFMNETRDIRKQLHDLHFEYGEMLRDPQTTIQDLKTMQKKMYELKKKLMDKVFAEE